MKTKDTKDLFAHKSKNWDMKSRRVKNAKSIASIIASNIKLDKDMQIADFGAGTGLLSFFLAQKVRLITAIDNSASMLEVFEQKSDEFEAKTEVCNINLATDYNQSFDNKFDGIVSSMTLHHIKDLDDIFAKFYNMIKKDGFIAIADLRSEDGSFHSDSTGVYHNGFDENLLRNIVKNCGFKNINFYDCDTINKENGKSYGVFCMIAYKK